LILLSLAVFTGLAGVIVALVADDEAWPDEEEEIARRRLAGTRGRRSTVTTTTSPATCEPVTRLETSTAR
jgi:hypothetical protein